MTGFMSRRGSLAGLVALSLFGAGSLRAQTNPLLPDDDTQVVTVTKTGSLRDFAAAAGYDGASPANIAFVVPTDTVIMGLSGGRSGLDTGKWPDGSRLWLTIDGNVFGGGGNGGDGGEVPGPSEGGKGGAGVYVQAPITIVITANGSLKGGGGGGGGGPGGGTGGSGGGGGFPNGLPGEAGSGTAVADSFARFSERGRNGTPGGGGTGGATGNPGGNGGNAGLPGENAGRIGGAAGNAVQKNGNAVVVLNYGQIYGEIF